MPSRPSKKDSISVSGKTLRSNDVGPDREETSTAIGFATFGGPLVLMTLAIWLVALAAACSIWYRTRR